MKKQLTILIALTAVAVLNAYSQSGNCLDFDGYNDRVVVQDDNSLDLSSKGTIEAWIYVESFKDWAGIVHKGERSDFNDEAYSLQFYGNGYNRYLAISVVDIYGGGQFQRSSTRLNANTWYHVAMVWNTAGSNNYIRLYINGNLDLNLTLNYSVVNSSGDLFIGSQYNNGYAFDGKIDNVRLWDRSFGKNAIRRLMYNNEYSTSNLKLAYMFDEATGYTAYDQTSNNNNGTLTSMSTSDWVTSSRPIGHVWEGSVDDDWNTDANWFAGWEVNKDIPAYISASATYQPVVKNTKECLDLTVENGASLTINAAKSLTVYGDLTVNGEMLIKSNSQNTGSLIDNGTVSGNGSMKIERYLSKEAWHYVSSPIQNATSNTFWGSAVYSYSESNSSWDPIKANETLENMKGYDVYIKSNTTVTFSGTYNTGSFSASELSVGADGWHLVGNPYPSSIDWDSESGWSKSNLEDAIYIWDDSKGTYVSYINGIGSHSDVDGIIAPTQSFWVKVNSRSGGTLGMNNNVRVHNTSGKFRSETSEKDILRLSVNSAGMTDETVLVFNEQANEYFEDQSDAHKMFSEKTNVPQLYTTSLDNKELSINSLPSINEKTSIPLNLKVRVSGESEIKINDSSVFDAAVNVYLEDLFTGEITDLRQTSHKFKASNTDAEDRFMIHFIKPQTIENPTSSLDNILETLEVFSSQKTVFIKNGIENSIISIYNIYGQEILNERLSNAGMHSYNISGASGYYMVSITAHGNQTTKKVFIQ